MRRVGAIPFIFKDGDPFVLFITSQTRMRWVLPKGAVKSRESDRRACAREAFEEAGIKGKVIEAFPMTALINKQMEDGLEAFPVTFYPFAIDSVDGKWPERKQRKRKWVRLHKAAKLAPAEDHRVLVRQFEELFPEILKSLG